MLMTPRPPPGRSGYEEPADGGAADWGAGAGLVGLETLNLG